MNVDEAEALLKTVRIIDPRIAVGGLIDPLQVALWAEMLADVPYRAAEAAMKEHYKTSTEVIMPGHIRPLMKKIMGAWKEQKRVGEQRRDQLERASRGELECRALPGELGDRREVMATVDRSAYSEAKAAAIAHMRSVTPPSRPVRIGGSMRAGKAAGRLQGGEEVPRGRDPERLGGLLRVVSSQVKPSIEEAA